MSAPRVVVLGGGFAGLETLFLLRHRLRDRVRLTLISDEETFLFRPNTIYIPFGADPQDFRVDLQEPVSRRDIEFVKGRVVDVDPSSQRVVLDGQDPVAYDHLVVATGAAMRPSEIPGLAEHANTIWTPDEMLDLRRELERITERARAGEMTRLLFLIPPNNKCSGPLYEMVFMIDTHLRRKGLRDAVDMIWTTSEANYIAAFGPRIHDVVVDEFAERGIEGHTGWTVTEVDPEAVHYENGERVGYDSLIAFPPYVSQVTYPAFPHDERGFIETEFESRRVQGTPNVYAPGDAGDFPVKQAFMAFLQADAAAEAIVGELEGTESRAPFDPVAMCVMEQFDKAVFAQVPLQLTGNPDQPVEVRPDANGEYKVGVSPLWRLGKKVLGIYLPMRFRAGEPFHAGAAWTMMDLGLKGMSSVLAD